MSQPPYGPPGQNPPYQQNPQYQQPGPPPQYGPPQQPQYGPPQQMPQNMPQYTPQFGPPQQGPGFGWGPNFGPGPGGPGWQPPRRKKSKAPLIAILALVAVGIVGGTLISLLRTATDDTTTPPVTPSRYTPKPTASPTGRPTSTATGSPTQASNETIVAKNAIYKVGQMASVGCKEPRVRPTNAKNAAAYWTAIKPCLDKSWKPLVEKAGYTFESPQMAFWSGTTVTNPCGDGAINVPFYCSANNILYMKVDVFVEAYTEYPGDPIAQAYARMWYTRSIAHEFGHGVQNMTGILQAASKLRYEQSDYAGQTRMTRRMELQANCFAGVFLAVNKASYPINGNMLYVWNKYVVTAGDKPEEGDHGSVASQGRFMGQSFKTGNPASCNTFSASPANVS